MILLPGVSPVRSLLAQGDWRSFSTEAGATPTCKNIFKKFRELFASFRGRLEVLRSFWMCSDVFGCVWMHSDAFGCFWMILSLFFKCPTLYERLPQTRSPRGPRLEVHPARAGSNAGSARNTGTQGAAQGHWAGHVLRPAETHVRHNAAILLPKIAIV